MDASEVSKTFKQIDPIWKRLRINRIWVLFFAAFCVVYLCFSVWASYTGMNKNIVNWAYLLYIFIWFSKVVAHFQQEGYWKRIGQRRMEAMHDAQPFLTTNQPPHNENALASPIMLHLRWHKGIVIAASSLVLIPILLLVIFGALDLYQHSHTFDFLEPLTFFIVIFLLVGVLIYFTYLRNMPSLIEINEAGIKTRYMRQDRFLPWEEARVFATYDAQGTKKSTFASTYELANERTVVRWSQQMLTNPFLFLALESNLDKKEDWNWQIGRINSIVASRTGLPLLDLSDGKQKRSTISERRNMFSNRPLNPVTSNVTAPTPIRIAQDDLLVSRMQLNGETGKVLWVLGGISIIFLVIGLEVRSDGIATRYGIVDSFVSWDDARLFACYGALRLMKRSSHIQLYELASEHTVVRWQWAHSRLWTLMLTPQMGREEFDRWLGQLQGYVVARTGLSLMDLDGPDHTPTPDLVRG